MISEKDGMTLMYVPAGEFTMGSDSGEADEKPVHTVNLDAYWIDRTDVTNKMYSLCVVAGVCREPTSKASYTHSSYYGNPEFDEAYCEWAGRRLPTEAEWEKAASWDDNTKTKRRYPWGDTIDCSYANYFGKDGGNKSCVGDTTPVDSYKSGKSPYGLYDMAGNVWEWMADWYSDTYYASSPASNPPGPDAGQSRVLRGGSWNFKDFNVRSADRNWNDPSLSFSIVGFRCSRSP
jgi:formylglycine-generating enzyme required for sulfatase activity